MLSNLRNFSKSKFAGILVFIIIIPFVFWGMGSVFSGGNTNSIAKINNINISTKDFINHINSSGLSQDIIKQNIDKNILEELLSDLISKNMIVAQINDFHMSMSDKILKKRITNNEIFFDENNKFSRIKYEKFLLENNTSAPEFETRLKTNELQKKLFSYISGGIKPPNFMINNTFVNENKNVEVKFINLENNYKKEFSNEEIKNYIKNNEELLKRDYIDISYVKINPENLTEVNEFNDDFFKKIDEIENSVLNGININEITKKYNLKLINKYNYFDESDENQILKEIYSKRNKDKIQLIDKNDFYLLYEIKKINKVLPDKKDKAFLDKINKKLFLKEKYEFNKTLLLKIQNKEFKEDDFLSLVNDKNKIKFTTLTSLNDINLFDLNSVKLLYSLPLNNFVLISDENKNIYISKIINIEFEDIINNSEKISEYKDRTKLTIKDNIYSSYDLFLNNEYDININQNTLERVKNYFR